MSLSFDDWKKANRNVRDFREMSAFGWKVFVLFWGKQEEAPEEAWNKALIEAYAQLLDHAFVHMRLKARRQLRKSIWWRGKFFEPALWENAALPMLGHAVIEDTLKAGFVPTLLELLMIAHDTEAYVRPSLLRLLWIAQISDGSEKPYAKAMLKQNGDQRSVGEALNGLREWMRTPSFKILDKPHRRALKELVASLKSSAVDQINLDDLRNWVDHRDFLLRRSEVVLHFHRRKGTRKPRRIRLPRAKITEMRRQLMGLVCLLKAFDWMFRLHEFGRAKRRRPVKAP